MPLVGLGRHVKWVQRFFDLFDVIKPFDIEITRILGCGEIGCAFAVKGNRVLKVTGSKDEAGTWDVIAEEQRRNPEAMRGIATVHRRPFGIWLPSVRKTLLYGILREGLKSVRETDRLYEGIKPIDGPKYLGDKRPLEGLEEMVMAVPETQLMAAAIHHLYVVTAGIYFLSDLHTSNVGTRKDENWLIVRDPGWAETPTQGEELIGWQPQGIVTLD